MPFEDKVAVRTFKFERPIVTRDERELRVVKFRRDVEAGDVDILASPGKTTQAQDRIGELPHGNLARNPASDQREVVGLRVNIKMQATNSVVKQLSRTDQLNLGIRRRLAAKQGRQIA